MMDTRSRRGSLLVGKRTWLSVLAALAVMTVFTIPVAATPRTTQSALPPPPPLPACSQIHSLHLDLQLNLRASAALVACGQATPGGQGPAAPMGPGTPQAGGTNVDVITGGETYPHVTQSEDQIWKHGSTVVVNYNDSRDAPSNYSGVSYSTNGGASFTRILPSPFATGHGTNYGDPIVVYNNKLGMWFAGDLATGCGGQGIGLWTSTNGSSWVAGACAVIDGAGDRESMWVDNTSTSPYFGRMYISWNDFNVGGGALYVTHSDDGTTWSQVQLNPTFIRDAQIGVAPNGNVLVMTMNEGGGGSNPRQNLVFRSTDGGVSFGGAISMGASFPAPGDLVSGYFAVVNPIWRYMGWGDLATGSNDVVIYSYTVHGTGSFGSGDGGDIYIVRSTDNGATWGSPMRIDGDSSGGEQWMPSTAGHGSNFVVAWYDRRNTTDGTNYERWGVTTTDGGLNWSTPRRISDTLIQQPAQPDPNVQAFYAGDYMRDYLHGSTFYDGWTDGRNAINGTYQQDVEVSKRRF
jgi:hypothetical protein